LLYEDETILWRFALPRAGWWRTAPRARLPIRPLRTVSDALHFTYSALRKWVHRFAHQGIQGLVDRPRPGRPPKVTCALAQHLDRLVDEDPLQHGALHSQWSCQALATVLARQTGVQVSRESVRAVLKKEGKLLSSHWSP